MMEKIQNDYESISY